MDPAAHARRPVIPTCVPPSFERRVVTISPRRAHRCDNTDWCDALIEVEQGDIVVEGIGGTLQWFGRGDVLCLVGMHLRAVHNCGAEPAVLIAVSRLPAALN